MKQSTYLIISLVVALLLIAVWVYLLFFSTPKDPKDVWNNFGLGGDEDIGIIIPPPIVDAEEPVVNLDRHRLRQLTTKPVIGFTEVMTATTTPPVLYYAEAGTGHIFTINLKTGAEERISNTTVAEASYAAFSPQGTLVALRSKNDRRANSFAWQRLGTTTSPLNLVEVQAYTFKVLNDNELLYSARTTTGLTSYALNLSTKVAKEIFTVPFFEASIVWGSTTQSKHYAYPKPTFALEGYLYEFSKGTMSRSSVDGFGLTAFITPGHIIYNRLANYKPESYIQKKGTTTSELSPIIMLPEKCTGSTVDQNTAWCGYEITQTPAEFPDAWYRGLSSYTDSIWEVNLSAQSATPLVETLSESGRAIDITRMTVGPSEQALYFINKNDNTLWMYEL